MAANKTSKSSESYFSRYKTGKVYEQNRRRKLQKQLTLQPNNADQINKALSNITWRRNAPKTPKWSHSAIAEIMLLKLFAKGPKEQVSSKLQKTKPQYGDFALGTRAKVMWA